MVLLEVGDQLQWAENGQIMVITTIRTIVHNGDKSYEFDRNGYFVPDYFVQSRILTGIIVKVDNELGCKHTFITYESFTHIFDYCTICNEKRV